MKALALLLLFAATGNATGVRPEIRYFRYERPVENASRTAGQTCVAVTPAVFAHAARGLADLRLYQGTVETPYVVREAAPVADADEAAPMLNLGRSGGRTVFDAAMPAGEYSNISLKIAGKNFIASVRVAGSQTESGARTSIGTYTIFDLTRQRLGRSTVLHLPKSDFGFLHFRIGGAIAPASVKGLTVLRVASTTPRYLAVASSSRVAQKGRDSVIEFTVPANTPVDRVVFVPGARPADFSRDVRIRVKPVRPPHGDEAAWPTEFYGSILRIHRVEEGHRLNEERLSVATPREVAGRASRWRVTIENGDDAPITLRSVRLEMVERELCFHAAAGAGYTLYYGDAALAGPQYDYATLFIAQPGAERASLGPENANPVYRPRPDTRPFTERHPGLLWAALVLVVVFLAVIALRSARATAPKEK